MLLAVAVALCSVVLHASQRSHGARTDTSVVVATVGTVTAAMLAYRVLINLPDPSSVVDIKVGATEEVALDAPEVRERFGQLGLEAAPTTPAGLREWVQSALAHWGPVIRESGYKLQ